MTDIKSFNSESLPDSTNSRNTSSGSQHYLISGSFGHVVCDSCDIFHLTIPVYLIISLFDLCNLDGVCSGTYLLHPFAGEDVEGDDVHLGVAVFARLRS